jgi:GNAT superfamily N-acetyltransferase
MNEFPDNDRHIPDMPHPGGIPEVSIGSSDSSTAPDAYTHPFDADTSNIGSEVNEHAYSTDADEADDLAVETEADVQARYRDAHAAIRRAAEVNTGQEIPQAGRASDIRYTKPLGATQIPAPARDLIDSVPVSERAEGVAYSEQHRVTGALPGMPRLGAPREEVRSAEVRFVRHEAIPNEPERNVAVTYQIDEHTTEGPQAEPTYEGHRRVSVETIAHSPSQGTTRTADLDAYANPEFVKQPISTDDLQPVVDHVETTAAPPEVNDSNPATPDDMRHLHDAVHAVTDFMPGTTQLRRFDQALPADAVPSAVQNAFDAVVEPPEGANIRYQVHAHTEGTEGGSQSTQVRYDRREMDADSDAVLRETRVQYDIQRTPQGMARDHGVPEYELTRSAGITIGGARGTPTTTARGGYGYGQIPGDNNTIVSRAEVHEIIDQIAAAIPLPAGSEAADAPVVTDTSRPSRGHELAGEPTTASWRQHTGEGASIKVTVGDNEQTIYANGNFSDHIVPNGFRFGPMRVESDFRQAGVATRMIQALAAVAIDNGAETLYGVVESPYIMRILAGIADESAVHFYTTDPVRGEDVELPMTVGQAIQSLEYAGRFEANLEKRNIGIFVQVDAVAINREQLETPQVTNEPLL